MLTGLYITLRFGHFISLMLAFGCVLYGAWWAPLTLRRLLMQRFFPLLRHLLLLSAVSALLMLMVQGGLMGNGWADLWQPAICKPSPAPALAASGSGRFCWRGLRWRSRGSNRVVRRVCCWCCCARRSC